MRYRGESDDPEIAMLSTHEGDSGYGAILASSFRFFRGHAEGKYTARTMSKLASLPLAWEESRESGIEGDFPFVATASKAYTFDEETETKSGGRIGMAVAWHNGTTVIAVHSNARRKHIGTALLERVSDVYRPVLWVGRQNIPGQMLCLQSGLYVTAMNATGALRMATGPMDEDGMEGDGNEYERAQQVLRTLRPRSRPRDLGEAIVAPADYPPPVISRLR